MIIGDLISTGFNGALHVLTINTVPGANVTAVLDNLRVSVIADNAGVAVLRLQKEGIWTITATDGVNTSTIDVEVSCQKAESIHFFPSDPPYDYKLIGTYATSQEWVAPNSGYFLIKAFGSSGNGGMADVYKVYNVDDGGYVYYTGTGGGGGGGGYSESTIKMNKGDTITLTAGAVGETTKAVINSSLEEYSVMQVTSGKNGGNAPRYGFGTGGGGGSASGGNQANINGGTGGDGSDQGTYSPKDLPGGTGGVGANGAPNGGDGGNFTTASGAGVAASGSPGFFQIYSGNTNSEIDFPEEPSEYNLISTYTDSHTWIAPEDGHFQVEIHGASGSGGKGRVSGVSNPDTAYYYSGGSGGGGGYSCSRIAMYAGDTIDLTAGSGTCSAFVNKAIESYTMSVTSGTNGADARSGGEAAAGTGGIATGGNYANANGSDGTMGCDKGKKGDDSIAYATPGGAPGHPDGNKGGNGGAAYKYGTGVSTGAGGAGLAGFIKIYRGDTNASDSTSLSGLTRLDYIESTGSQYIDTGCVPSSTMKVIINLTPISSGMSEHAIFGSTWAANGFFLMFYQNKLRWHSKGASVDADGVNATTKNEIICTQSELTVNGTSYSLNGTGTDSTKNITLFYAGDYVAANNGIYKLHACQIFENGVLIRDYVPVLDNKGVPCLYDKLNHTITHNKGTGRFLYKESH